jgi:hypothetical protein
MEGLAEDEDHMHMKQLDNGEKMSRVLDFFLDTQPYVKCSIADITNNWPKLSKNEARDLENLLKASGLFIVFDKVGAPLFMLKDSARDEMIKIGSYAKFLADSKIQERITGKDAAGDDDKKQDEDHRLKRKRENKIITIVGVAIIIIGIVLAKIILNKIVSH